jgi:hypothetical protein
MATSLYGQEYGRHILVRGGLRDDEMQLNY